MSTNNLDQPILTKDVIPSATDSTAHLSASGNGMDALGTLQTARDSAPNTAQPHLPALDIIGHPNAGAGSESSGIYTNTKGGLTFQQEDFADGTHRAVFHEKGATMVEGWDDQHNLKAVLYDDATGKVEWSMNGSSDGTLDSKSFNPANGKMMLEEVRSPDGSWTASGPAAGSGSLSADSPVPIISNNSNLDSGSEGSEGSAGTANGAPSNPTWDGLESNGGPVGGNTNIETSDPGLEYPNGDNYDHRPPSGQVGQAGQGGGGFGSSETAGSRGRSNANNGAALEGHGGT